MPRFVDRRDAGVQLARRLQRFNGRDDVLVLCLTRGGVPVAMEVARAIHAPLEVLHYGRVSVHPSRAGSRITLGGSSPTEAGARNLIRSSVSLHASHKGNRPLVDTARDIRGRIVIVVDDGLETTTTMTIAEQLIRPLGPARLVVAAPVGAADVCATLRCLVDECVVALAPFPFRKLSDWYSDLPDDDLADVREICWVDTTEPGLAAVTGELAASRATRPYLLPRMPSSGTAAVSPSGS